MVKKIFLEKEVLSKDNVKIKYWTRLTDKNKKTLFFIHGFVGNHTVFKNEAKYFAKYSDYNIVMIDCRAHGLSEAPKNLNQYHIDYFANDIKEIIKKENLKNIILIGHSFGGVISCNAYHIMKIKIKGIILFDSIYSEPIKYFSKLNIFFELGYLTIRQIFNLKYKNPRKYIDYTSNKNYRNSFLKGASKMPFFAVAFMWEKLFEFDSNKVFSNIHTRTLAVEAKGDIYSKITHMKNIKKNIKNLEYLSINEKSHEFLFLKYKKTTNLIKTFVESS